MKDELGQERRSVKVRESLIAVLFAVVIAIGVWTVALPAITSESRDDDGNRADSAEERPAGGQEPQSQGAKP